MPENIATEVDLTLAAHVPHAFIALGHGPDIDTAFDDAVDTAWYEYGHAGIVTTIASADPASIQIENQSPTSRTLATSQSQRHLLTASPAVTYARPICSDSAFRRRRVPLVTTDPTLELPEQKGIFTYLSPELQITLLALAAAAGLGPTDLEVLESVDLRTHTQRFRPISTSHKGPTRRVYQATETTTHQVIATTATAGEARRAAVELIRQGPYAGHNVYTIEVDQKVGRAPDLPFVTVTRTRIAQRASLRLTYITPKNPDKPPKVIGWLFYGIVPPLVL